MSWKKPVLAAALLAVALVGAACSSSGPSGSTSSTIPSGSSGSSSDAATAAKALGIDTSKCATDPTAKLTSPIKVGQIYPESGGPATAFAPIGAAVKAAFAARADDSTQTPTLNLTQSDDQFVPAQTLTAAKQLIEQTKVAALTTVLGTANIIGLGPQLNEDCVPLIAAQAGGASADAPDKAPWTVTWTLPSTVDVRIWVADLVARHPEGAKVAVFSADDSSGKDYVDAIKHYLQGTKSTIVSQQTVEDTDSAAPSSQVTSMRASGATVLMSAPTGAQCVSEMKEVAAQGWKPTQYMSYTCPASLFDLTGSAADGVFVNQYIKDPTRAPYNTDPAVVAAVAELKKYAPSTPANNTSLAGLVYVEALFKAVAQAASSPLGLSRLGLLEAATHMNYQPDLTLTGVTFHTDYPKDEVAMEGAELTSYNAGPKTFNYIKLYNFDGQMTGIASS